MLVVRDERLVVGALSQLAAVLLDGQGDVAEVAGRELVSLVDLEGEALPEGHVADVGRPRRDVVRPPEVAPDPRRRTCLRVERADAEDLGEGAGGRGGGRRGDGVVGDVRLTVSRGDRSVGE